MATLVLVEGILSGTTWDIVKAAHAQKIKVFAVAQRPERFTHVADWFEEVLPCDTSQAEAIVEAVYGKVPDLAGLTSTQDNFMPQANEAARRLGLPCLATDVLQSVQDKSLTRDLLAEGLLAKVNPRYRVLTADNRALGDLSEIGQQVVVKPAELFGSILVRRFDGPAGVEDFVAECFDRHGIEGAVLVEEYVAGVEVSAEVYNGRCYGLTEVFIAEGEGGMIEAGQVHPWKADPALYRRGCAIAEGVAEVLGISWGPAHIQFRVRDGEFYLLEVNSRLGGGIVVRIVKEATGIDLATMHVCELVNRTPPPVAGSRDRECFAAGIFLLASTERSGTLVEWEGVEQARAVPGVTDTFLLVPAGNHVTVGHSNMDRLAYVTAVGDSREAVLDSIHRGLGSMKPRFHKDPGSQGAAAGLDALSLKTRSYGTKRAMATAHQAPTSRAPVAAHAEPVVVGGGAVEPEPGVS